MKHDEQYQNRHSHVEEFWAPYEIEIASYDDLVRAIDKIFTKWKSKTFAWRGQSDSSWPLYSSLYRRVSWSTPDKLLEEREFYKREGDILTELHRWGLHMSSSLGRLSVLNQLAALQHYGAPTRLIDVTFNPWIGVWFAVEPKRDNGLPSGDDKDARLFAIDVSDRLINEKHELRPWEDNMKRPWQGNPERNPPEDIREAFLTWCTKVYAWRPAHFDGRISAQNGGFIFGGVPLSTGPDGKQNQWPRDGKGTWTIEQVRAVTSISLRPHKLDAKRGGVAQDAVYTFRILASAKKEIRERLERQFGYRHSTIYPDFTGFAQFGTPDLPTRPVEKI